MTDKEAMAMALKALENSVDLVVEDAYNAEQLYGNYPTRQGKVGGLKILADQHKEAITALKERLADHMREVQRLGQEIEQEPVAWQFMNGSSFRKRRPDDFSDLASDGLPYWRPLYTTPPQRTEQSGWRKVQIDDAEEEAWKELEKKND